MMKTGKVLIFTVIIVVLILGVCGCDRNYKNQSSELTDNAKNNGVDVNIIKKCISEQEEGGYYTVKDYVVSNDKFIALLSEAEQDNYLFLTIYNATTMEVFIPFPEPQVRVGDVTATDDKGFDVKCDFGNYFIGFDGTMMVKGKGTPRGQNIP